MFKRVPSPLAKPSRQEPSAPPDRVDSLYHALKSLQGELPCVGWPATVNREFCDALRSEGYIHNYGGKLTLAPKALEVISSVEDNQRKDAEEIAQRGQDQQLKEEKERKRARRETFRFTVTIILSILVPISCYVLNVLAGVDTPFRRWLLELVHQTISPP